MRPAIVVITERTEITLPTLGTKRTTFARVSVLCTIDRIMNQSPARTKPYYIARLVDKTQAPHEIPDKDGEVWVQIVKSANPDLVKELKFLWQSMHQKEILEL